VADRYCRNCGHELSETDRFCPNCASPVQDVAHVPTPEADVPVPPPPQQAGGTTQPPPQQATAQPQGRSTASKLLIGCAALLVLPILFVGCLALLGGGGGGGGDQANSPPERNEQDEGVEGGGRDAEANKPLQGEQANQQGQQPAPTPKYTVGQTATVGNVEWTVTDAYLTNQLRSGFGTQKRGRFVVVDFTFTNNRPEEVTLDPELHMILKDSQGREFGTDADAWEFVPTNLNIFLEPVNPGISTNGRVVYQVPPDANGFTLTVDDVELMEDKSAVFDLGNIRPQTYDTASPTATAGG